MIKKTMKKVTKKKVATKKPLRKMVNGGTKNNEDGSENPAGGPKKVTTVSNSGEYKTVTKNNTKPYGNKSGSTTTVRRTVKGALVGAPTVKKAKQARTERSSVTGNSYPTYYNVGMGDFKKGGKVVTRKKK